MAAGYWDTTITYKQLAKTLVILFVFYITLTTTLDYHKALDKATDSEDFAYTLYMPHTQHPPSNINIPAQIDMGFKRDAYTKSATGIINCRPNDITQLQNKRVCTGNTISRGCSQAEIDKSKTEIQKEIVIEKEAYNQYLNDQNNLDTVKTLHERITNTNQIIDTEMKRLNEKVTKKTEL
jgi:hypothetical protein